MARKIKISEEQYNRLNEMINEVDVAVHKMQGENFDTAIQRTAKDANANGIGQKVDNYTVSAPDVTNESRTITKKQIKESRKRFLDENSTVYTLDDFRKIVRK